MGDVTNDNANGSAEGSLGKAGGARAAVPRPPGPRSPRLLPPIGNGEVPGPDHHTAGSWQSQKQEDKPRSRFHSDCTVTPSIYLDWSAARSDKKTYTQYTGRIPKRGKNRSITSFKDSEEQEVMEYLENNTGFLESYIAECVPVEVLEKWLIAKMRINYKNTSVSSNKQQLVPYRQKDNICNNQIFMDLLKVLKDEPSEHTVLLELARYIVKSVGVDAYRVYKLYPDHPTFVQYFVMESDKTSEAAPAKSLRRAAPGRVGPVLAAARSGACRRLARADDPLRFPEMPTCLHEALKLKNVKEARHVMYQPILSKTGKTTYVIEMWRIKDRFRDRDEEVSSNFLVLGSLALHYCNLYLDKKRERNMSDFLLDVVKEIFEEMVSLDQLIKRILEFAQRLVNADRASLFLVDYRNFELVSTVFDLKFEPGHDRDMEKKEIRMPINRGIAGHVALSGETMNIPDAYSDYRFNREVDEATGYKTVSILCMPIKVEGRIIGVVQMVNKRNDDNFGREDEAAFEIFSTFFGLALHHARLYDRIIRKEQKYRVALEVLSYHNTCRETEVQNMLSDKDPIAVDLNDFYLDPFKFDEFQKCKCVISMFKDLFDLSQFDIVTLTRFVLTVKKNYRTVPYHNFDHGWSVAHAMYVLLKSDHRNRYNNKMRLALFVACLCHDLDHRGYTNKYMSEIASPLAAMYTTSTLEHHHFNITVTILQQDGHNIFSHISSEDYKEILSFIRHCILATDLAAFFPNLERMRDLNSEHSKQQFSWAVNSHRDLAMAISMTAADLSASAKPWDIQIKTVKVIFEEFYEQGDKEREAGRAPIPMMDRNQPDEQPASQVGFLSQICIPCYDMLHRILPNSTPMYTMALKNLDRWRFRADRVLRRLRDEKKDSDDDSAASVEGIIETDIEDLTDDEITPCDVRHKATKHGLGVVIEVKRSSITWEEDGVKREEMLRSGIWKDIDGATWMDEEGVVLNKNPLKAIDHDKGGK